MVMGACRRDARHSARPRVERCSDDLSGTWRAESDARFRYRVADRKREIVFEPLYEIGGAGSQYGAFRIVLTRAADGKLVGASETSFSEAGKTCPIRFPARIESCASGKLTLTSETQFQVRIENCQVSSTGMATTAVLVREDETASR